jgi:hypothetical protein
MSTVKLGAPEFLILIAVGIFAVPALSAGLIARDRHLSFWAFFVTGLVLPIVGIVLALVWPVPALARLTPASSAGWHRDPSGRFDERYFDGRRWTKGVQRSGERFEDPL